MAAISSSAVINPTDFLWESDWYPHSHPKPTHMPQLYADVIHSIVFFLHLSDLSIAIRLNHLWNNSIRSLQLRSRVRNGLEYSLELTKERWKAIKRHRNSPLLNHVTCIHLQYCPLRCGFISDFFPSLRSLCATDRQVTSFVDFVSGRRIRTQAALDAILMNKNLTSVDLSSNAVDDEGVCRIVEAIKAGRTNDQLKHLNLSNNRICNPGFYSLGELMGRSPSLTSINLSFNLEIRAAGATVIADALKTSESLTSFDISGNVIDVGCLAILADGIKQCKTLRMLNLSFSSINAVGAVSIAEAIKNHKSLTSLDLSNNEIGDKGVSTIAEAVDDNPSLTHVDLNSNKYNDQRWSDVVEALRGKSESVVNYQYKLG